MSEREASTVETQWCASAFRPNSITYKLANYSPIKSYRFMVMITVRNTVESILTFK